MALCNTDKYQAINGFCYWLVEIENFEMKLQYSYKICGYF